MIIQTINLHEFRDAFKNYGRENQYTYDGLEVLFDYLDEFDTELDVIAICCDFTEDTIHNIAIIYGIEEHEVMDYLNDNYIVCGQTDTTIIYGDF